MERNFKISKGQFTKSLEETNASIRGICGDLGEILIGIIKKAKSLNAGEEVLLGLEKSLKKNGAIFDKTVLIEGMCLGLRREFEAERKEEAERAELEMVLANNLDEDGKIHFNELAMYVITDKGAEK